MASTPRHRHHLQQRQQQQQQQQLCGQLQPNSISISIDSCSCWMGTQHMSDVCCESILLLAAPAAVARLLQWQHGCDAGVAIWQHGCDAGVAIWQHGCDAGVAIWQHGCDAGVAIWQRLSIDLYTV
jgi:hypothetical protein